MEAVDQALLFGFLGRDKDELAKNVLVMGGLRLHCFLMIPIITIIFFKFI